MIILIWVVALPFLYWVWLGITLTAIDYAIYLGWQEKENDMGTFVNSRGETVNRHRLIRYGQVAGQDHPDLLSVYDEERNIIHIDRELAAELPQQVIERLEVTVIPATRVANNFVGFGPYNREVIHTL